MTYCGTNQNSTGCDRVRSIQNGGVQTYTISFAYSKFSDIHVYQRIGNAWSEIAPDDVTYPWTIESATPCVVRFTEATSANWPPSGVDNVKVQRITEPSLAEFIPGSAIRAEDLNNNDTELLFVDEETACEILDLQTFDFSIELGDLNDVDDANATAGQILEYDGSI